MTTTSCWSARTTWQTRLRTSIRERSMWIIRPRPAARSAMMTMCARMPLSTTTSLICRWTTYARLFSATPMEAVCHRCCVPPQRVTSLSSGADMVPTVGACVGATVLAVRYSPVNECVTSSKSWTTAMAIAVVCLPSRPASAGSSERPSWDCPT